MNMRKRLWILITTFMLIILTVPSFSWAGEKKPKVDGTSVIMMDKASGQVLYARNSEEKRDPASITKILTCLIVLENLDQDKVVTITENSSHIGVNIDMHKGEKLTVEQLLYAMMLPSANDAARALAIATAGDIGSFCKMMNERARECGAESTHFTNPNGLNLAGQEHHRTTAKDLALITSEALDNKAFRKLVTTTSYTIPATNKSGERKLKTTNPLLKSSKSIKVGGADIPLEYDKATGVKTGTTSVAGNCFAASAKDGNTELVAIVLNSGEYTRFTDAIRLFEYGFSNFATEIPVKKNEEIEKLRVKRGACGYVSAGAGESLAVTCQRNDDGEIVKSGNTVKMIPADEKVVAPIKKGEKVGTVQIVDKSGDIVKSTDAIALESVDKGGPLSVIGIPDNMVPLFVTVLINIAAIIAIARFLLRSRKKNKGCNCAGDVLEEKD